MTLEGFLIISVIITIAAAEVALGLAIVMSVYKDKQSIFIKDASNLKG